MDGEVTLGRAIREVRMASGWKQKQLAEAIGVTHTYVCHLEADRREPSVRLLRSISDVLGAPPGLFLALALWADMPDKERAEYRPIFNSLISLASLSGHARPEAPGRLHSQDPWPDSMA